jgi:hypothetical protein
MVSCHDEDIKEINQYEYKISLGEVTIVEIDNRIKYFNYDKNQISVNLLNSNSLRISPRIAGLSQIEILYDNNKYETVNIIVPSDIYLIELFQLDIKVNDYSISESIRKEITENIYPPRFSQFSFFEDSVFVITLFKEVGEDKIWGRYHFDDSKIEIDTPEKKHSYEYILNYKGRQGYNVFKEDMTDFYKKKYPDIEIGVVCLIYKIVKRRLIG